MLKAAMKYGTYISLGSDAHCLYDILNFEFILPIIEELNFPKDKIINSNKELFYSIVKKDKTNIE